MQVVNSVVQERNVLEKWYTLRGWAERERPLRIRTTIIEAEGVLQKLRKPRKRMEGKKRWVHFREPERMIGKEVS